MNETLSEGYSGEATLILYLKEVFRVEDKEKILSEPLKEASLFFPEVRRLTSYYCKEYRRSETEYPECRLKYHFKRALFSRRDIDNPPLRGLRSEE